MNHLTNFQQNLILLARAARKSSFSVPVGVGKTNQKTMNPYQTGNQMIDGDDGRDFRSPHYVEPKAETCSTCEGSGRVSDRDEESGEYQTTHCPECLGEGYTE